MAGAWALVEWQWSHAPRRWDIQLLVVLALGGRSTHCFIKLGAVHTRHASISWSRRFPLGDYGRKATVATLATLMVAVRLGRERYPLARPEVGSTTRLIAVPTAKELPADHRDRAAGEGGTLGGGGTHPTLDDGACAKETTVTADLVTTEHDCGDGPTILRTRETPDSHTSLPHGERRL